MKLKSFLIGETILAFALLCPAQTGGWQKVADIEIRPNEVWKFRDGPVTCYFVDSVVYSYATAHSISCVK